MNLSYIFLCLYSRTDVMAGFHHPRDPYFPNQGNKGWIVEDRDEDPEEILEEDSEEEAEFEVKEEEDESDTGSKVIDPPYMARIPAHRWGYNGRTPRWADDLERWNQHQRQCLPYGMERGFYNLYHGGPADRALPVMILRTSDIRDHAQTTANWVI